MMADAVCTGCGKPLTGDSSRSGVCPSCLMQLALGEGETSSSTDENPWFDTATMGPDWIDKYRIVQRVGVGGMGHVYMAEQREPVRRLVAVKLLKRGMDSHEVIARFEAERQALAMMNHPGVAQVLDAGETEDGRPFFVMEYVKGVPIHEYCDEEGLSVLERVRLFMQACEAVHHAHQKGIIHRDLKPSNIMVTVEDGMPRAKVIDFGVAKAIRQRLTRETLHTQVGVVVGTPEYMSPEQAGRGEGQVDTRSDVYSLGVVLYELLVGALPFDPELLRRLPFVEMIRLLRDDDPPRPTSRLSSLGDEVRELADQRATDPKTLLRFLRGDLEWVVMKALDKDPARRYGTASEFAEDLRRYIDSEPVSASPPNPFYKARKFVTRHRVAVIAAALVLMSLIAGVIASTVLFLREQQARSEAEWQSYVANLSVAGIHLADGKRDEALERLESCAPEMRDWEWDYLMNQANSRAAESVLESPVDEIFTSNDLRTIYARDGINAWQASLAPMRAPAGEPVSLSRTALAGAASGRGRPIALTSDGSRLAVMATPSEDGEPGRAIVLDTRTGVVTADVELGSTLPGYAALDRAGTRLAVFPDIPREAPPDAYAIEVHDLVTRDEPFRLIMRERTRSRGVDVHTPMAFVGRGDFLVTGGWIGPLSIWDLNEKRLIGSTDLEAITTIAVSPNSRFVIVGDGDGAVRLLSVSGLRKGPALERHSRGVTAAAFSDDSRRVATGGEDGLIRISEVPSGRLIATLDLTDQAEKVLSLSFGKDGSLSASTGEQLLHWLPGELASVRALGMATDPVVVSASGRMYAAAYDSPERIQIWSSRTLLPITAWKGQGNGVLDLDFSNDGGRLVSGGGNREASDSSVGGPGKDRFLSVFLWDPAKGERIAAFSGHRDVVTSVRFSNVGLKIASGSVDGTVRFWDADKLEALHSIDVGEAVLAVEFGPDDEWLAVGTESGRTLLYDPTTGAFERELLSAPAYELGSRLLVDTQGRWLAMTTEEGGALFDLSTGQQVLDLPQGDSVLGLRGDGRRLLVRSGSTLQIWPTDKLQPALSLSVPDDATPRSAVFSRDGRDLLLATDQRFVVYRSTPSDRESRPGSPLAVEPSS